MNIKKQIAALDAVVRDLFKRGGPQLASYPNGRRGGNEPTIDQVAESPVGWRTPEAILEAERRRRIKSWRST